MSPNPSRSRALLILATLSATPLPATTPAIAQTAGQPCNPTDYVCRGAQGELATPPAAAQPEKQPQLSGFIWLGDLKDDVIDSRTVKLATKPVTALKDLAPNAELDILNAVYLRAAKPANDADYFRGQKIVGLLDRGQRVRLLAAPEKISRPSGLVQLWGSVQRIDPK